MVYRTSTWVDVPWRTVSHNQMVGWTLCFLGIDHLSELPKIMVILSNSWLCEKRLRSNISKTRFQSTRFGHLQHAWTHLASGEEQPMTDFFCVDITSWMEAAAITAWGWGFTHYTHLSLGGKILRYPRNPTLLLEPRWTTTGLHCSSL